MDIIINKNIKVKNKNNKKIIYGINEETQLNDFISDNNFNFHYNVKDYRKQIEIKSGNVCTGDVIKIYLNETEIISYNIVIYGDINGDGKINSVDALAIIKNKLGLSKINNDIYEEAGRTTMNSREKNLVPSAVDALAVIKNKLNLELIFQN